MAMEENIKTAFTFAADANKQLLTISTAVLAFTITFCKEFLADKAYIAKGWLIGSWVCLFFSIVFGLWTLFALAGTLEKVPVDKLSIYRGNIAFPCFMQVLMFLIALGLAITAGTKSLRNESTAARIAANPPKIITSEFPET